MPAFDLVQFDSYGAKSSCTKVITPDVKIVIDPGVAIMHPSFPASIEEKIRWMEEGRKRIYNALEDADIVIITHYHHDHYIKDAGIYGGKVIFLKNPNVYINDSQRKRAINFLKNIAKFFNIDLPIRKPKLKEMKDIELRSLSLDFGDYNARRKELLRKGRKWFQRRVKSWINEEYIDEIWSKKITIKYAEESNFLFGDTMVRFTGPLFHGIEYSRTGWVYSVIIECGEQKIFYSSDLNGPIIEDYADMIIKEEPNIIILDGPMTYMIGYTLNRINLRRVIKNVIRIINSVDYDVFIWDHHLPREKRFRERTHEVWKHALMNGKEILTAREYKYKRSPVVEEL